MNGTDSSPSARVLGTTSTLVLSIWPSLGVAGKLATSVLALVLTLILAGSIVLSNAPPNAPHTKEVAALPGPERPRWYGWLLGNCLDLTEHRDSLINPAWAAAGRTGRYLSLLAQERVYTYDPAAVRYIFNHVDEFERPEDARRILGRIMGAGSLVAVNGAVHKRQRRVMDPAFSTTAIKDMVPAMFDKAVELENLLGRFVAEEGLEKYASAIPPKDVDRQVKGGRKVDMLSIMSRMTTDVIGQVFFQHDFDSLSQPEGSDIVHAFDRLVDAAHEAAPIAECQNAVPILDKIPSKNRREIDSCRELMANLSDELMEKRKSTLHADDKDLFALLIRAGEADHMSVEEIRAQMATLFFAGSTTTSATISSALHHLARYPDVQRRLRAEVESIGEDKPSFDTLNSLPLLEKVVRETLRYTPPATCTARKATRDTVVPLEWPVTGRDGSLIESLPVKKGTYFFISMMMLNRQPDVWGADADSFNPDRFDDPTLPLLSVPGVWGGVSSFILGPYSCIGYRLSLAEIKVVLFTVLRRFQFDELPSRPEVEYMSSLATRPQVKGEPGGQLPLLVSSLANRV